MDDKIKIINEFLSQDSINKSGFWREVGKSSNYWGIVMREGRDPSYSTVQKIFEVMRKYGYKDENE